jgi:predicted amidohydrolase
MPTTEKPNASDAAGRIEPYMALALQPNLRGVRERSEIKRNLKNITELMHAAVWLTGVDMPIRLICIPEGALQGFTDEIFDMNHVEYVKKIAIDVPGEETEYLGRLAEKFNTYIMAQAKVKHPEFPERFFNCAFCINPKGEVILKHYKLQVFTREHSTVPHDVWDKWTQLYGTGLDAFFPVVDTEIGRLGACICFEGSFPETARGLAMNGAEVVYRPAYSEPYVSNGVWEVQNRARALDNNMYIVAPNIGGYYVTPESDDPLDVGGGHSMIVDYQGRVISNHKTGGDVSWAAAIIDVGQLRVYRQTSLFGNFLKDLRLEQYRIIYEGPSIYEPNLALHEPPQNHEVTEQRMRARMEKLYERGIWKRP